ncbi:hypothetical protein F5884DRAFT_340359 [Xylogone sp. PMI_703]|nr:hypothetical protein F5884DRAFT_340359 [Xylogone sp. PMI_703]
MELGYPKLAHFITGEFYPIVRKYEELAVRDLLFQQAELNELDRQYKSAVQRDAQQTDDRQYYHRHWILCKTSSLAGCAAEQRNIALKIRSKLREYYNAILRYSKIASLPLPKDPERHLLREWIENTADGGFCRFLDYDLRGKGQPSVYDDQYQKDLAFLSDSHGEDDFFTRFVTGPLLTLFHRLWGKEGTPLPIHRGDPSTLYYYDDKIIKIINDILGTVFSCMAPLTSIVVLSFVGNHHARLGLVCVFSLLFCCCLAVATRARRIEIFAATAAFASVQVVFISTDN